MGYKELARNIKDGYNSLKKEPVFKYYNVTWNCKLRTAEISVKNDAEFKAIIIGNTGNVPESRGYMYLFYTNDRKVPFPSVKEIVRRLKIVANRGILTDKDADYFDWEEYGSLEKQRIYFSEIIKREAKMDQMEEVNPVGEKMEFIDAMMKRADEVDNAVYRMCLTLLELENEKDYEERFPWNIGILEEIKESVIRILNKNQYKVCNPFIENEEEDRKFCELDSCGLTECARHP